jgi:tetratricopeptide (TPR) repeat protein
MRSRSAERQTDCQLNISAYYEADRLYRVGRYREALRVFRISADADPNDGDCWIAIGSCHDALKQPAKAEAAYRKALELSEPKRRPALNFNIGNSYFDRGLFADAIRHYDLVPKGHEVWPAADRNRQLALAELGRNSSSKPNPLRGSA